MKVKKGLEWFLLILVLSASCVLSGIIMNRAESFFKPLDDSESADTVVVTDTIFVDRPIVRDSTIVKYVFRSFKVVDTLLVVDTIRDSIIIEIPISQKVYEEDDYKAWVSGYEPSLDSIQVYSRETIIKAKPKRWSIGLQAGYGLTTKGFAPYVGVGVGYKLPP